MSRADEIILCQPDSRKGCSVCCGLFNIRDTAKETLQKFLDGGKGREKLYRVYEEFTEPEAVRDRFSHICPYQGFLSEGKPGCLIHPLSSGIEGRDRSLFASSVCGRFLCPAHELLPVEKKSVLIQNVDDWYLYSIAIIDPDSFSFIYQYARSICTLSDISRLINAGLEAHAQNLLNYDGILFFYSIPEYSINRELFSLNYRDDYRSAVIEAMDKCHAGKE
jgi:hypothetical protein